MDWPERAKHGLNGPSTHTYTQIHRFTDSQIHRIRPKRASHRIRPGQGSKAAVRQPTRPRQAVSKAQGNTPKVIRRMGLARESEAWIEWPKSGLLLHAQSQV